MTKPIIGIVGNMEILDKGMFPGYIRSYINYDYITSIVQAGGIPLILPIVKDEKIIQSQIKSVDGIVISGGCDVNPLLYGEEPTQKQGFILKERDDFDVSVVKIATALKKPILGICRGLQILNVVFGGTLYQDLSFIDGCYIKHFQESRPSLQGHTVNIYKGTKLHDILGESVISVNSFHHQAVKDIASGFIVNAISKDFVVEGIEKQGEDCVLGIQWHPEMMTAQGDMQMRKIFEKFVEKSTKFGG